MPRAARPRDSPTTRRDSVLALGLRWRPRIGGSIAVRSVDQLNGAVWKRSMPFEPHRSVRSGPWCTERHSIAQQERQDDHSKAIDRSQLKEGLDDSRTTEQLHVSLQIRGA